MKKGLKILGTVAFFCFPLVFIGSNHEDVVQRHPDWDFWNYLGAYSLVYICIFFAQCCVGMLWAMEDL